MGTSWLAWHGEQEALAFLHIAVRAGVKPINGVRVVSQPLVSRSKRATPSASLPDLIRQSSFVLRRSSTWKLDHRVTPLRGGPG